MDTSFLGNRRKRIFTFPRKRGRQTHKSVSLASLKEIVSFISQLWVTFHPCVESRWYWQNHMSCHHFKSGISGSAPQFKCKDIIS
jgi:hypothetical protein